MENKIMRKILVKIIDNKIYFKNRRKLTENYQNMLNTNIISDNELLFSDEYIDQNKKIVKDKDVINWLKKNQLKVGEITGYQKEKAFSSSLAPWIDFKNIFGPCNERLMLKAIRLYGAFSMLNVCFSNDKLLSIGMPKPPKFTDYIKYCIETTKHLSIQQQMEVDFK